MSHLLYSGVLSALLASACTAPDAFVPELPVHETVFTIAVLPDTQVYSQSNPEIFDSQTDWLVAQRDNLNLAMVVHVGDLVDASWLTKQWENARASMGILDDYVPYLIAPGNHDYGRVYEERNARARSTLFHDYFPRSLFELMPTFGGFLPEGERTDNSYHVLEFGDQKWLFMALEFAPRDTTLTWANQILSAHPDHLAVIVTHAYLYHDDTRYSWTARGESQKWSPYSYGVAALPEGINDGEGIWEQLISQHANVVAVLSGHTLADGLGYAVSVGAGEVHEILANYQMNDIGGAGYLRLLQVNTATAEIEVVTYSPWLDQYKTDWANRFRFSYASHLR